MTPIGTDQRMKKRKKSVSICAIRGPKQTGSREEKALAGFGADGHSGSYIQSTQTTHVTRPKILKINWTTKPSGWVSGLYVRKEKMKIAKNILVIVTALLCLRTLILGASGMMPFLSPGMIDPEAFTNFSVSTIYSCSIAALVGILALIAIWLSAKPQNGGVWKLLILIAVSIPYAIISYFAFQRYFRFQQFAQDITELKAIPDDIHFVLSGMATASISGAAIILFLLVVFQSFSKSEPDAVVNASSAAGNSKNQQDH
jgi:hypothetical protein